MWKRSIWSSCVVRRRQDAIGERQWQSRAEQRVVASDQLIVHVRRGDLVISDMRDLSRGSRWRDIGLLIFIDGHPELGPSMLATRIANDHGVLLCEALARRYLVERSENDREFLRKNRFFLGSLRLIAAIDFLPRQHDQFIAFLRDSFLPMIRSAQACE